MELIKSLDEKTKLFAWIYKPFDYDNLSQDETIMSITNLTKKYSIPHNILIYKVTEYLYKKINNQQIIDKLYQHRLITVNDIKQISDHIAFLDKSDPTIKIFDDNIVNIIKPLTKFYSTYSYSNTNHTGYPLPDPEKGRAHMGWCECYHSGCHKKFPSSDELRKHLISHGRFIHNFHVLHEEAVRVKSLTAEKILTQKLTHCPSYVCDIKNFTPEKLCDHLTILGIEPFWQKGLKINIKQDLNFNTIYYEDQCVICCDTTPCVLYLPCNHCVSCYNCYKKVDKCPTCRTKITTSIMI